MPARCPLLILIGGPNGAGKTTFARQFLRSVGVTEFLNADSIAAGLSPFDPPAASIRAARLLLTRWHELVRDGRDFAFESTLSGRSYAKMLREARQRGYKIHLCYLYLPDVRYSIRRVRERVKKGGHNIPLTDLRRRFLPSLRNLFKIYLPLSDHAVLHDATLQPPRLLVEWTGERAHVLHPNAYEKVLEQAR
jgi:predicted ABC-type ATPase